MKKWFFIFSLSFFPSMFNPFFVYLVTWIKEIHTFANNECLTFHNFISTGALCNVNFLMMFCILCADHINTTFREQITNISLTLETNWHTYRMRISRLAFFLCIRILDSTYIISKPFSWKFLNTTYASPFRNDLNIVLYWWL